MYVASRMIQLSPYQWYAVSCTVIAVLRVGLYLYVLISSRLYYHLGYVIRKHLTYPSRWLPLFLTSSLTRLEGLTCTSFLVANVVCICWFFNDRKGANRTSADLAVIHLIAVVLTSTLPTFSSVFKISASRARLVHAHATILMLIDSIVHIVLTSLDEGLAINGISISGILGCGAALLASCTPYLCLRTYFFEFTVRIHLVLGLTTIVALQYHVMDISVVKFYLIGAVSAWFTLRGLFVLRDVFYNLHLRSTQWLPKATVHTKFYDQRGRTQNIIGALHVSISMKSRFSYQPGQYVYITIPMLGFQTAFQQHPFVIVAVERDSEEKCRIWLLVQKKRGFTRRLSTICDEAYTALVSGPFGLEYDFGRYGTVAMLATGIGIAAQLPFLRSLIKGVNNARVRTRRILLVWYVSVLDHDKWAKKWLDELLVNDPSFMLEIRIHGEGGDYHSVDDRGRYISKRLDSGQTAIAGEHGMVKMMAGPFNFTDVVRELQSDRERKGQILVSVSIDKTLRTQVRDQVVACMDQDMFYHEHEFQPAAMRTRPVL